MPQIHLRAEPGDYAPVVLLPGDPNRATWIAEKFDGGPGAALQVNSHRGLLGYTGRYRGVPVSVQTSGMGAPSMAIVVEELLRLGAERLIRVGTCGGIGRGIQTGDIVIASGSTPADGATRTYLHGDPYAPVADFRLMRALVETAETRGEKPYVGQVATVDVFYNPDPDYFSRWRSRGVLAFEMETSVLYYLASRARAAGANVAAAAILTVSDVLSEETTSEESYMPLEELNRSIERMIEIALDAGIAG
ncbi:MAG: purine-nucleoside phosphorylase [Candidatus Limnocylindrales bacterium]|jgi:DeoD family purine-nucleoside phosphorylase